MKKSKDNCPTCKGTGLQRKERKDAPDFRCQDCNGDGERKTFEMIFWRYDQFPFLLGSPGFMQDNGMAYCPSYQGQFRPVKVLSLAEGKQLWDKLEGLQRERNEMLKAIEVGWKARLDQLAPWRHKGS